MNLKMIYSNYESYSAFAVAADIGVNYYDEEIVDRTPVLGFRSESRGAG